MSGMANFLVLKIKAKTGFSPSIAALFAVAAVMAVVAFVLLNVTIYVVLSERFGSWQTALGMTIAYVVLCLVFAFVAMRTHRSNIEQAKQELATQSASTLFDGSALTLGLEVGRTIGWKRLVPIAAVAMIAAGLAREWKKSQPKGDEA